MNDRQETFHVDRDAAGVVIDHPHRALMTAPEYALPERKQPGHNFSIDDMMRIAEVIARGGLFGSSDVNAVATLCMLAHSEGQHPAVVFRDYNIIKGRPSKTAEAMQRDFLLAGGQIEWHCLSDVAAAATFSHPRGGVARIDWDMERAQKAELLGKSGGSNGASNMWQKYPRQLLRARVLSEGVRTVWPAATGGMYEPGEIYDINDDAPGQRTNTARRGRPSLTDEEARANAETWVQRQIERVKECADHEALLGLMQASHDRMRKLARNAADLYALVQQSYERRDGELHGYDMGDDEAAAAFAAFDITRREWREALDGCSDIEDVKRIEKDWVKGRATASGALIDAVERMIASRKASFKSAD